MRPARPRWPAISVLLAACAAPAPAQDAAVVNTVTAVVYTVQDLSGAATTHEFEQTITDAVSAAFEASGSFTLVPPADWEAGARSRSLGARDLLSGGPASELAGALKADVAVSGTYSVVDLDGTQYILVSLQCWDTRDARLVAGVEKTTRFDLAFYLALQDWIAGFIPTISLAAAAPAASVIAGPSRPLIREITFKSPQEGMEVLISGETSAGIIAEGKLDFPLGAMPEGTPFQVTKRKAGYHDAVQNVKAAREVVLSPLAKTSSLAGELDWTIGEILGAGGALRWYPVPDTVFASLGAYLFLQPSVSAAPRAVFHGDASLLLGGYLFFPPNFPVRLSVAAGAGLVLSVLTVPGFPLYTDYYLTVASFTVETSLLGLPLFFRIDSRYALGLGNNVVGRGWVPGMPLMTLGVLFKW